MMQKILVLLLVLIGLPVVRASVAHPEAVQRQASHWHRALAYGGPPTWFSAAFTVDDRGYVVTGYDFTNALWQYDARANTWTRKADFPGAPRGAALAFAVGDKGYVGTGFHEDVRFSDFWEYDPSADRWAKKAAIPGRVRDQAAAFVIGRKAYVAGGMTCDGNGCPDLDELWEYDARSDQWTRRADMPQAASAPACFVVNGKAYVVAGRAGATLTRTVFEYDPQTNRWTRKAAFPGPPRMRAVGFSMRGRGYVATGIQSISPASVTVLRDLWEYDAPRDAWTQKPDVSGPARGAAVAFVTDSRVFIGTGVDSTRTVLRDFWWADPAGIAPVPKVVPTQSRPQPGRSTHS